MPAWKRTIDLVTCGLAFLLLWPIALVAAMLVRLTSEGPFILSQERAGQDGLAFRLYKFRTLQTDADPTNQDIDHLNERDGPAFKIEDDPRATPVGRWLRVTGIDELPQFWNVFKGEMSIVGPRPLPLHEMEAVETRYRARLQVKPGLTCFWQLRGREVSFQQWMELDLKYVETQGPFLDLVLILSTPLVLLRASFSSGFAAVAKLSVLGVLVDAVEPQEAVDEVLLAARVGTPLAVSALATHGVMTGVEDPEHRYRLNRLDLVVPDGQPVRWTLNRSYGLSLKERVYGPALMLSLCEAAAIEGLPIFLYGSTERVVGTLAEQLSKRFPGLVIAGLLPSKFRNLSEVEEQENIALSQIGHPFSASCRTCRELAVKCFRKGRPR